MNKLGFSSLTKVHESLTEVAQFYLYFFLLFKLFLLFKYNIPVFFPLQEFILEKVLSLSGPLLKDTSMLDSVIKSKDVISMAEERCSEADVSC